VFLHRARRVQFCNASHVHVPVNRRWIHSPGSVMRRRLDEGVAGAAGAKAPRQGIFSHSAALGRPLRDRALREASDCQQLQIATAAACKARLQSEAGNYKQARLASNGPAAEPTDMARKLTEAALWILCYSPETLLLRHGVY
ncbi:unnamed protein product, partial [Effrenium voratum]